MNRSDQKPSTKAKVEAPLTKLAIFDMDGTVFSSHLNWLEVKKDLGIEGNILKELSKGGEAATQKMAKLEEYEAASTAQATPTEGVFEFVRYLKSHGTTCVLATNNNKTNADYLLKKYKITFDTVITRESKLWKPDPDAFLYLMDKYHYGTSETISIGDSHYDVKASIAAQIDNIFIIKKSKASSKLLTEFEKSFTYFNDFRHLQQIFIKNGWPK